MKLSVIGINYLVNKINHLTVDKAITINHPNMPIHQKKKETIVLKGSVLKAFVLSVQY